jgi:hypothetical protein
MGKLLKSRVAQILAALGSTIALLLAGGANWKP